MLLTRYVIPRCYIARVDEPLIPLTSLNSPILIFDSDGNSFSINDPRCDEFGIKTCHGCEKVKLLTAFTPGYPQCRSCVSTYQQEWRQENIEQERANGRRRYAENPDAQRDRALKCNYGWSLAGYNEIKAAQGGVCAICRQPETGVVRGDRQLDLAIDHDHSHDWAHPTKKACPECIRGLLCRDCNVAMGKFHDDPELLRAAVRYLEKWKKRRAPHR